MEKEETNTGVQEVLSELNEDFLDNELIQDNKVYFSQNDVLYRARMADQAELSLAKLKRNSEYIRLLQTENTLTRKKLKKILKENDDTNIDLMQKEADEFEKQLKELYISLAPCKDDEVKTVAKFKKQIEDVKEKRSKIVYKIAEKMAPCVENQADDYYMEYLTFACTEKFKSENKSEEDARKGEWIPVWKSFKDFEKDLDRNLRLTATGWLTHLLINR